MILATRMGRWISSFSSSRGLTMESFGQGRDVGPATEFWPLTDVNVSDALNQLDLGLAIVEGLNSGFHQIDSCQESSEDETVRGGEREERGGLGRKRMG
jgi:hypothetical protein